MSDPIQRARELLDRLNEPRPDRPLHPETARLARATGLDPDQLSAALYDSDRSMVASEPRAQRRVEQVEQLPSLQQMREAVDRRKLEDEWQRLRRERPYFTKGTA
jgi:hypothetical protein